jgi:acetate kinase
LLVSTHKPNAERRIPVAVSARHAHLTLPTIDALFGSGYQLTKRMDLSQHGQYAANETIALIGPRGRIDKVRVMGPPRKEDQIEISRTDEFVLGIDAPVRLSGDLANTPGITLEGPNGQLTIARGVICARRHIHMNPGDAARFGVQDRQSVDVRIDSDGRDLTFSDVIVRVSPDFELEMHVDTDEGNAAEVVRHQEGQVFAPMKADAAIQAVKSDPISKS